MPNFLAAGTGRAVLGLLDPPHASFADHVWLTVVGRDGFWPVARDADISVTVLQVVALRAAKNGGLQVPQATIDNAVKYVKRCYHPESGGFALLKKQ